MAAALAPVGDALRVAAGRVAHLGRVVGAARNITLALIEPSRTTTRFMPSMTIVASNCWRSAPTRVRTCGSTRSSSSSVVSSSPSIP